MIQIQDWRMIGYYFNVVMCFAEDVQDTENEQEILEVGKAIYQIGQEPGLDAAQRWIREYHGAAMAAFVKKVWKPLYNWPAFDEFQDGVKAEAVPSPPIYSRFGSYVAWWRSRHDKDDAASVQEGHQEGAKL